jgi:parallel beta-helix repeat protein
VSATVSIEACTAATNDFGIVGTVANTLRNNTITSNRDGGISCLSDCTVVGNTVTANGPVGILVTSDDNRIEANNISRNTLGLSVTAPGNLIVRNSASGNTTNWSLVAGNRYGPFVDITAAGSAAVTTNAAVSTLTSTDANANHSY